ncbi:type IV secretion system protein VirD4 [Bosea sp. BE125]|uniref:type IV secretory system conjugative DNA transfer family protein n=1 Tax=Bosea sp. BE125 TaxID=2817909 RepID=UPI00285ABFBE|nr:type IV secretory system conjugative DNA transfer family protein [Bosea sp. BE125]MDR6871109.1 type IV secretion system protein VirD4 [Bosea sp. BE125]
MLNFLDNVHLSLSLWCGRHFRGLLTFTTGAPVAWLAARRETNAWGQLIPTGQIQLNQLTQVVMVGAGGFIAGFCAVAIIVLMRRYRDVAIALLALAGLYITLVPFVGNMMIPIAALTGLAVGLAIAYARFLYDASPRSTTFGSAMWANAAHIDENGLFAGDGLYLGRFPVTDVASGNVELKALRYIGDRHGLTIGPARSGKGAGTVLPNLLTYRGSVICIDPKGENALVSLPARHRMGQKLHVVDPWGLVAPLYKIPAARFNPLDWLQTDPAHINENALIIADSLVVSSGGKEQFWDEEAKAFLVGIILHVATDAEEEGRRNLGRVRDCLLLDADGTEALLRRMYQSNNAVVSGAGARGLQKEEKLLANVLASAQSHTHFLDSPQVRESLSASDFRFEDLKHDSASVFLILPADRMKPFARWLRLLLQQAITVNARNIAHKPERPILFMLDEMAALGKLTMVEQAYGLMAGYGMLMWGIVQDIGQLEHIYGKGWSTFVANSGVLQYLGSRDAQTAEYFSKLCGTTTVKTLSSGLSRAVSSSVGKQGGGETTTSSSNTGEAARSLVLPDELMTMRKDIQLVLVENMNPIAARKIVWHSDPAFENLGVNLHRAPKAPAAPASQAVANLPSPARARSSTDSRPARSTGGNPSG